MTFSFYLFIIISLVVKIISARQGNEGSDHLSW